MSTIPTSNWTKGELAPELQARIDTNQYAAGAKRVRNFIIQRYGGLAFRTGFRFVGEVDDVNETLRYTPFQYNIEQSYVLTIGNTRLRLLAGGGYVIEDNAQITAITRELQPTVTSTLHGYTVGDRIYFSGIVGMTELNGQSATVLSAPTTNTYTISINTTGYTPFISSDGIVRSVPPPALPAPPAPPPVPDPVPAPPPTTGGGGSGGDLGELPGRGNDGLQLN